MNPDTAIKTMGKYTFLRFVNGIEMAEGIGITRAGSRDEAIRGAIALCKDDPKAVLVLVEEPKPLSMTTLSDREIEAVARKRYRVEIRRLNRSTDAEIEAAALTEVLETELQASLIRDISRPNIEDREIEAVASQIAPLVPLEFGSLWNPNYAPSWPEDYSERERKIRRDIAKAAIAALDQERVKALTPQEEERQDQAT